MKVILHVGLDVHNDSIAVSLAPRTRPRCGATASLAARTSTCRSSSKQLQKAHPQATLRFCYEAGPRGFPRAPGDRVKTDRRLHRAQNYFGDLYRRWKARLGAPKAVTAMAHKLARVLRHLLKYRQEFDWKVFAKEEEK